MSVSCVPSMAATAAPVAASKREKTAWTPGRLREEFEGKEVTSLTPMKEEDQAGMRRREEGEREEGFKGKIWRGGIWTEVDGREDWRWVRTTEKGRRERTVAASRKTAMVEKRREDIARELARSKPNKKLL